jgi:hypothetical protein
MAQPYECEADLGNRLLPPQKFRMREGGYKFLAIGRREVQMKSGRFLSNWGGIVVLLLLGGYSTQGSHAQLAVTTATLSGTVSDSAGAVLPEAKVTLTSPERGITRTFTTGAQGN